jgi:hypothetical protein
MRHFRHNSHRQYASSSSVANSNSTYQKGTVTVNAANLKLPYILRIQTSGSELTGQISLDGALITKLERTSTEINLSPYLSVGKHQLEITAKYLPVSAAIAIAFSGSGTAVTQQTSGNGILQYTLTILVN